MEIVRVKEALHTAIMLSDAAHSSHMVDIDCIGPVQIDNGQAAFITETGERKRITRENLDQRLGELMSESFNEKIKRQIQVMSFT